MINEFKISANQISNNYAINRHQLLDVSLAEVSEIYFNNLATLSGPVSINYDNNSDAKFQNCFSLLFPNKIQTTIINEFRKFFNIVETQIDPNKIDFNITKAQDDEICINKKSENGLSKIIINDDGIVIFTFTAFANINEPDEFKPLYVHDEKAFDFESFCYTFLSK